MCDMSFYAPRFHALGIEVQRLHAQRAELEKADMPSIKKLKLCSMIDDELSALEPRLDQITEAIDDMIRMDTVGGPQ